MSRYTAEENGMTKREQMIDACNRMAEWCWKLMRINRKAFEAGEMSEQDFRYVKNRLSKAESQFRKVIALLSEPHTCDECAHSNYYMVRIGDDCRDKAEEWDCDKMAEMTDEDVRLSNEGHCPYWVRTEPEEEFTQEEIDGYLSDL